MARKRYTPEQIIGMLREAEVRFSQGENVGETSRSLEISERSFFGPFRDGAARSDAMVIKVAEEERER